MKNNLTRRAILQSLGLGLLAVGCRSVVEPLSEVTPITEAPTATTEPTATLSPTETVAPTPTITPQSRWDDVLPVEIPEGRIVDIVNGRTHALAILEDGSVWGWGYGLALGLPMEDYILPTQLKHLPTVKQADAVVFASAFVDTNGDIFIANPAFGNEFVHLDGLSDVKKVVLYEPNTVFALTEGGEVWVLAKEGERTIILPDNASIGTGNFEKLDVDNVVDIKADVSLFMRRANGELWIWGATGAHTPSDYYVTPQRYPYVNGIQDMAKGSDVIVVLNNGTVWQEDENNGEIVLGLSNVIQIQGSAGTAENIALTDAGVLWGWGYLPYRFDPSNVNNFPDRYVEQPVEINTPAPIEKMDYYIGDLLTLDTNGTVWSWADGFLGLENETIQRPTDEEFPISILTSSG